MLAIAIAIAIIIIIIIGTRDDRPVQSGINSSSSSRYVRV
jgi:hypothetical protein